tara:strand:- start:254 stop:478 length:225 start_codon:yes stop_codon:yes gene_type:complete
MQSTQNEKFSTERPSVQIAGTPLQKQWRILNFHEARLKQLESNMNEDTLTVLNSLVEQVNELKAEIAEIKKSNE